MEPASHILIIFLNFSTHKTQFSVASLELCYVFRYVWYSILFLLRHMPPSTGRFQPTNHSSSLDKELCWIMTGHAYRFNNIDNWTLISQCSINRMVYNVILETIKLSSALNLPTHVNWYDISLKSDSLNKEVGKLKLRIWKYFTTMDQNELITTHKDSSISTFFLVFSLLMLFKRIFFKQYHRAFFFHKTIDK